MPTFQLVMRRGPKAGTKFELKTQTVIVGRDSSADLSINDPEVSRNHCRLILDRSYYIQDLGSTNGTFVDGQRLGGEPTKLQSGQIIQLGSNVTLLYQEVQSREYILDTSAPEMPGRQTAPIEQTPESTAVPTGFQRSTIEEPPADLKIQLNEEEAAAPPATPPSFNDPLPAATAASQAALDRPTADFLSYTPRSNDEFGEDEERVEDNRRLYVIIAVIVGILLLCCCVLLLIVGVLYTQQDLVNDLLNPAAPVEDTGAALPILINYLF